MIEHDIIYQTQAERYERLIASEDAEDNLLRAIQTIVPDLTVLDAVDIGSGTGRLARLLAPQVRSILLTDASQAMLDIAAKQLTEAKMTNWRTSQGVNDRLPLVNQSVDLLTAGWTICYSASSNVPNWRTNLQAILAEMERVIRPGGTAIIFENYGTGASEPNPPSFLKDYYRALEQQHGFEHRYIRTDFHFASEEEAFALIDFFFGSEFSQQVVNDQTVHFPECTGIWWKSF
ncbi:class I SAM-dependent methyltransferase [Paenibacillus sacheonensis]|uniref:Methyltransferase domain-containing protein n=1 Tax=Paenibacillus sacheonensis TaxID=742054 RepID=A0A7X4YTE5_9BACL|nr:class I SAM-dependent methyltransferase [Paenibacillus sacheonensis]MBM7563517.1 ubiquinone/menaquinone biosynthesis C-methylase UbiE [Paenibacillus sacheonensis]NBC71184.1 methyltransferase domain-containing protein [Paenibacillus sacheonensis]